MTGNAASIRTCRRAGYMIWVSFLPVGILLVPPVTALFERERSLFSRTFLLAESGMCVLFMVVALILYVVIGKKNKAYAKKSSVPRLYSAACGAIFALLFPRVWRSQCTSPSRRQLLWTARMSPNGLGCRECRGSFLLPAFLALSR